MRVARTWQPQFIQDVFVRSDGAVPDGPFASTALGKLAGEAMEERIHVHKMTQEVEHRVSHDAQGVFAVADLNSCRDLLGRVPQTPHPFLAAFWQMRDPGNAGTVIRSADAAGCDAVVLVGDCVDIFNPKVIRAKQPSRKFLVGDCDTGYYMHDGNYRVSKNYNPAMPSAFGFFPHHNKRRSGSMLYLDGHADQLFMSGMDIPKTSGWWYIESDSY